MANQWGRDSQLPSGRGAGGTIIAVLVALSLGAAASYGYMRFSQPDLTTEMLELTEQNALLRQSLSETQTKLEQSTKALENNGTAKSATDDALRQLEAAKASSDTELAELRKRLAEQAVELDRLTEQLAVASNSGTQTSEQQQQAQIEDLNNRLRQVQASAEAAEADKLRLESELAALKRQSQETAGTANRELEDLRQSVVPGLRAEIDRLGQQIKQQSVEKTDLQTRLETLQGQAQADRDARTQLNNELRAARARIAELEKVLAAKAAGDAQVTPSLVTPSEQTTTPAEQQPAKSTRTPRDAKLVDSALSRAPGLNSLTPDQTTILRSALVDGACVTDALDAAFDRVPVITLRNLIRDLNSDC